MGVSVGEKSKGSGIYYLFIRHPSLPGGRLTRRVPGSGKEARELAFELKRQLDAKITLKEPLFPQEEEKQLPTLSEYFASWQNGSMKSLAPKTQRSYFDQFEKYIARALGSKRLDDIRRSDVKQFILSLKNIRIVRKNKRRLLAKNTVRLIVAALSRVFSEAIDDELLQVNPVSRQGKNYKELGTFFEINPFNEDEARTFQEVASEKAPFYFPAFAAAIHAGLREGEVIGLIWTDVDFDRKVLNIRRQGKDRAKTKTKKSRQVEMSDFLFRVLKDLFKQRAEQFQRIPEHVFCSMAGTPLDPDNLRRKFRELLTLAKLKHRRIHDLRHTFATIHLQNGSPLQWVSKQLGHAKITMTADTYYHYLPDTYKGDHRNTIPGLQAPAVSKLKIAKG